MIAVSPVYKALAGVLALALLVACGYFAGRHNVQEKWDAQKRADAASDNLKQVKGDAFTTVFITKVVEHTTEIKVKGDTIVKEVPVYVTAQDDLDYRVNRGFVRVLNAAAQGAPLADTAQTTDRSPAGVAISSIAGIVADNYTRCLLYKQRAEDLVTWYNEQAAIANAPTP